MQELRADGVRARCLGHTTAASLWSSLGSLPPLSSNGISQRVSLQGHRLTCTTDQEWVQRLPSKSWIRLWCQKHRRR